MSSVKSETDTEATEEGMLSRWSRRKHEARSYQLDEESSNKVLMVEAEIDGAEAPVESVEAEEPVELEVYLPDDSDMPALESLDEDSDYSGFMSPKVSEGLRTLALRQLFRGSVFNVRDGLDDYDDDFTQFTKLGDIVTAEMRRQMARLKQASEDEQDDTVATTESLSAEDGSELPVNVESSDTAVSSEDELEIDGEHAADSEHITENENFTEKDASGEKLYVSKNG
ncbi:MAG: DUF3306 domain-containing protein [Gammaproteobacteria bacterium]|nr:DUF3306 domain-containing protein [Gammaproteobacteria bacterium]